MTKKTEAVEPVETALPNAAEMNKAGEDGYAEPSENDVAVNPVFDAAVADAIADEFAEEEVVQEEVVTAPVEPTAASNPLAIVWPQDETGFLSGLKKELSKASSRVNGHPGKMKTLTDTLRIAAKSAQLRFEDQKQANQDTLVRLVAAQELQSTREQAERDAYIARLENQLKAARAE